MMTKVIQQFSFSKEMMLPVGAKFLCMSYQLGFSSPQMWFEVDSNEGRTEKRFFRYIKTGNIYSSTEVLSMNYLATLPEVGGNNVWHYFEIYLEE